MSRASSPGSTQGSGAMGLSVCLELDLVVYSSGVVIGPAKAFGGTKSILKGNSYE